MYRATTPTFGFRLPAEIAELSEKVLVTFKQNKKTVLEKTFLKEDFTGDEIIFTFTQEEANLFEAGKTCEVQARVRTADNYVFASKVYYVAVNFVLNDEEL